MVIIPVTSMNDGRREGDETVAITLQQPQIIFVIVETAAPVRLSIQDDTTVSHPVMSVAAVWHHAGKGDKQITFIINRTGNEKNFSMVIAKAQACEVLV